MSISLAWPLSGVIVAVVAVILAVVVIRFLWQHILRFLVHIVLSIAGIIAVLALLHYVFHLF
jgi:predicted exporter